METLGSLIGKMRIERGISQSVLAKGLCSSQMLAKIENDERNPDKLLADHLLQRLGKCPDRLEIILSLEEYEEIELRNSVQEYILQGKITEAKMALDLYMRTYKSSSLREQFCLQMHAFIADEIDEEVSKRMNLLVQAMEITQPHWQEGLQKKCLYSTAELENLIDIATMKVKYGDEIWGLYTLKKIYDYIQERYSDVNEKVKILPKCACCLAEKYLSKEMYVEAQRILEDSFEILRNTGVIYYMVPVMDNLIKLYKFQKNENKVKFIENRRDALIDIHRDYNLEYKLKERMFYNYTIADYHLDCEIISGARKNQGMTQEVLGDGIYESPESVSRIENGIYAPSKSKFPKLMEKLGLKETRYNGYVITNDFEILELEGNISRMTAHRKNTEAQYEMEILRELIKGDSSFNRQRICMYETMFEIITSVAPYSESLEKAYNNLKRTYELNAEEYRVPMGTETYIINQIAMIYYRLNKLEKAIGLLQETLSIYEASRVNYKYHYAHVGLILSNLAKYLEENNMNDLASDMAIKSMILFLEQGKGEKINSALISQACAGEKSGKNKNACERWFRQAFYMSDLFKQSLDARIIDTYFRDNYDGGIIWD